MTSRYTRRLFPVLLVILAAFTGQWAAFGVGLAAQASIYASQSQNAKPASTSEQPLAPRPPRRDPPEYFEPQPNPPDFLVVSDRFQRPPPSSLSCLT